MQGISSTPSVEQDDGYNRLQATVAATVASLVDSVSKTDVKADLLWHAYLEGFPTSDRQHYNCSCCRRFIERFGGLVTINERGISKSLFWSSEETSPFFRASVAAMRKLVESAAVVGVFLSSEKMWGVPISQRESRTWSHLAGLPVHSFSHPTLSAGQMMAEKKQEFGIVQHGLSDYPLDVVEQAVRVLDAGALYRSEKASGVANWFRDLHLALTGTANAVQKKNIVWRTVAKAPVGYCHIRSTIISTLLDDIKGELPFDDLARRWQEKLHPLQYLRPSAAPTAGAIAQAEKLVEQLGLAKSFERRYATLDDVLAKLWMPKIDTEKAGGSGGFFSHLRAKVSRTKELVLPIAPITWEKFQRTVLSDAVEIEIQLPARGPFYGLLTASEPNAPPIHQWDGLAGHVRNPVSWYFYDGGSKPVSWNLHCEWADVTAVFPSPTLWQEPGKFAHHGQSVYFSLAGCWDSLAKQAGLGLFPESLKSELHGIRSVLEAHSRKGVLQNPESGTANGISFSKNSEPLTVRVHSSTGITLYTLDRWD